MVLSYWRQKYQHWRIFFKRCKLNIMIIKNNMRVVYQISQQNKLNNNKN